MLETTQSSEVQVAIPDETIEKKIYFIRGQKVMLDADLAQLYGVRTKVLNQAVKRNRERFPEDFMFLLTKQEVMNWSQIVTSSKIKHSPHVYAFTEQGVAMLSSVLRSRCAIQVNIAIMRMFVKLKQMMLDHKELAWKLSELEGKVGKHDEEIKSIFEVIRRLLTAPAVESPPENPKRSIGFHAD